MFIINSFNKFKIAFFNSVVVSCFKYNSKRKMYIDFLSSLPIIEKYSHKYRLIFIFSTNSSTI